MPTNHFDSHRAKFLADALRTTLAQFAKDHNVGLKVGKLGYDLHKASVKIEMTPDASVTPEAVEWNRHAQFTIEGLYGVNREALGQRFFFKGSHYTVVGFRATSNKAPFICDREDGARFFFPAKTLLTVCPQFAVAKIVPTLVETEVPFRG